jgi:hypothetical protein
MTRTTKITGAAVAVTVAAVTVGTTQIKCNASLPVCIGANILQQFQFDPNNGQLFQAVEIWGMDPKTGKVTIYKIWAPSTRPPTEKGYSMIPADLRGLQGSRQGARQGFRVEDGMPTWALARQGKGEPQEEVSVSMKGVASHAIP